MARVEIDGRKKVNWAAANHSDTQGALRRLTREVEGRARANLSRARATTEWDKIDDPEHMTSIGSASSTGKYGHVDYVVWMDGFKGGAMAIEFGHAPSGVFGPKGRFRDRISKAPHGLYILTRAAMLPAKAMIHGGRRKNVRFGRKRGKR